MTDIFISYAREDSAAAGWIAKRAIAAGYKVWWDRELAAGAEIQEVIRKEIMSAKRVLVIWSRNSVKSRWVLDEADLAARYSKLLPICIDDSEPPLGFGVYNVKYMSDWDADFKTILKSMPPRTVAYTMSHVVQDTNLDKRSVKSLLDGFDGDSVKRTAEILGRRGYDSYAKWLGERTLKATSSDLFGKLMSPTRDPQTKRLSASGPTQGLLIPRCFAGVCDFFIVAVIWFAVLRSTIAYSGPWLELISFGAIWFIYQAAMIAGPGRGQTFGGMFAQTRMVDQKTGNPPSSRAAMYAAATTLLPISVLWYFVDPRQRMLHNIASKTIVVPA